VRYRHVKKCEKNWCRPTR